MGNRNSSNEIEPQPYLLSGKERLLLCKNWPKMMRAEPELFRAIWRKAVQRSFTIKETFGIGEGDDPDENQSFVRLTMSVEALFHRLIVSRRLEEEQLSDTCLELGRKHITYIPRGFQAILWDVFMVCLMDTIEKANLGVSGQKRIQLIRAWQKLVHTMVEYMREGYAQEQLAHGVMRCHTD